MMNNQKLTPSLLTASFKCKKRRESSNSPKEQEQQQGEAVVKRRRTAEVYAEEDDNDQMEIHIMMNDSSASKAPATTTKRPLQQLRLDDYFNPCSTADSSSSRRAPPHTGTKEVHHSSITTSSTSTTSSSPTIVVGHPRNYLITSMIPDELLWDIQIMAFGWGAAENSYDDGTTGGGGFLDLKSFMAASKACRDSVVRNEKLWRGVFFYAGYHNQLPRSFCHGLTSTGLVTWRKLTWSLLARTCAFCFERTPFYSLLLSARICPNCQENDAYAILVPLRIAKSVVRSVVRDHQLQHSAAVVVGAPTTTTTTSTTMKKGKEECCCGGDSPRRPPQQLPCQSPQAGEQGIYTAPPSPSSPPPPPPVPVLLVSEASFADRVKQLHQQVTYVGAERSSNKDEGGVSPSSSPTTIEDEEVDGSTSSSRTKRLTTPPVFKFIPGLYQDDEANDDDQETDSIPRNMLGFTTLGSVVGAVVVAVAAATQQRGNNNDGHNKKTEGDFIFECVFKELTRQSTGTITPTTYSQFSSTTTTRMSSGRLLPSISGGSNSRTRVSSVTKGVISPPPSATSVLFNQSLLLQSEGFFTNNPQYGMEYIPGHFFYSVTPDIFVGPNCRFASVAAAVEEAEEGDTIYVEKGEYNETVTIDKSIHLIGDPEGGTVIWHGCLGYIPVIAVASCRLSNLTIQQLFVNNNHDPHDPDKSTALSIYDEEYTNQMIPHVPTNVEVSNCRLTSRSASACMVQGGANAFFSSCTVDTTPWAGIVLFEAASAVIESCRFHNCRTWGMQIEDAKSLVAWNNVVSDDCKMGALDIYDGATIDDDARFRGIPRIMDDTNLVTAGAGGSSSASVSSPTSLLLEQSGVTPPPTTFPRVSCACHALVGFGNNRTTPATDTASAAAGGDGGTTAVVAEETGGVRGEENDEHAQSRNRSVTVDEDDGRSVQEEEMRQEEYDEGGASAAATLTTSARHQPLAPTTPPSVTDAPQEVEEEEEEPDAFEARNGYYCVGWNQAQQKLTPLCHLTASMHPDKRVYPLKRTASSATTTSAGSSSIERRLVLQRSDDDDVAEGDEGDEGQATTGDRTREPISENSIPKFPQKGGGVSKEERVRDSNNLFLPSHLPISVLQSRTLETIVVDDDEECHHYRKSASSGTTTNSTTRPGRGGDQRCSPQDGEWRKHSSSRREARFLDESMWWRR